MNERLRLFVKGLNSCVMRRGKLRQYKTLLSEMGHEIVSAPQDSDGILVWTCAFREDVKQASIRELERYRREYGPRIFVAGCLPDIDPQSIEHFSRDLVIPWKGDLDRLKDLFAVEPVDMHHVSPAYAEDKVCDDAGKYRQENPGKYVTFQDQFIKLVISEGCNFKCAYCSERLAFPDFRSFPMDDIIRACREKVDRTHHYDVMLLADSLGEYGTDTGTDLPCLIGRILEIDPRIRVALNNLNPASFLVYRRRLAEFIKKGKISHINLPIQSASEKMLKAMNRQYLKMDIETIFDLFKRTRFEDFDTHIIVGFPGETDADIDETISLLEFYHPRYVLASKFMAVPGMKAAADLSGTVSADDVSRRLGKIASRLDAQGIIVNYDNGRIIRSKIDRLKVNE